MPIPRFAQNFCRARAWGISLWLVLSLLQAIPLHSQGAPTPRPSVVQWQPEKLVNGSPVLFQVSASPKVQSVSGSWFGHDLNFFHPATGKFWYALAGVPVETAPGRYDLTVKEMPATGKPADIQVKIKIAAAAYPKITIQVAKQFTEPDPEQLREIAADKDIKQKTFVAETPDRLWTGPFLPPVSAPISDVFGTARVINQEVKSRHLGLDYGAPAGTPVHAVNHGTVLLARPLFFEGNCVVLDHGQGLMSLYLHLSQFSVKEGDEVAPGQLIGLSGGTGRATGPHLHLAIRWQGVYLNPAILLKLNLP
jgi:murein DD-endopeptidase MepM/ murein hydrolase activator NlpD